MNEVGVFEGKAQFSAIVEAAERGESTVITKRGKAVARVVPVQRGKPSDAFGMDEGLVRMASDFNDTPEGFEEYT